MQIVIWNLGDIKERIFPTQEAFDKLSKSIQKVREQGGGDIVWGPELKVKTINVSDHINIIGADNIIIEKVDDNTFTVKTKES